VVALLVGFGLEADRVGVGEGFAEAERVGLGVVDGVGSVDEDRVGFGVAVGVADVRGEVAVPAGPGSDGEALVGDAPAPSTAPASAARSVIAGAPSEYDRTAARPVTVPTLTRRARFTTAPPS
jgi:hypothetical protein